MKEVGKRNMRSQGRADLFCVDTSQKQTILFRSPTSHYGQPYSGIEGYALKERMSAIATSACFLLK